MTSHQEPARHVAPGSRRPLATWALMAAGLAATVLMLALADAGRPGPPWWLAIPTVLGLIGAWLAARKDAPGWMIASGVWGIALVPAVLVVVTVVAGP